MYSYAYEIKIYYENLVDRYYNDELVVEEKILVMVMMVSEKDFLYQMVQDKMDSIEAYSMKLNTNKIYKSLQSNI
jgi:hypothetical protein